MVHVLMRAVGRLVVSVCSLGVIAMATRVF